MYSESRQPVFKLLLPKDAERLLTVNNFPGQRPMHAEKVKDYINNMDTGKHRRVEIAVARVKSTGIDYLMNGQHNCRAVVVRNKPYPAMLSYYTCDTMEDAWRLFATFDVHAPRTERQLLHSRRGLFRDERLHNMPLSVLQACGSALYAIGDGDDPSFTGWRGVRDKTLKADLIEKYIEDVLFVSRYGEVRHLMRVGVVAAIIVTRRRNEKAASEFWDKVSTGEMMTIGDPRRKLRDGLLDMHFLAKVNGGTPAQRMTYGFCISWWNSWRKGDSRRSVKVGSMQTLPKVAA